MNQDLVSVIMPTYNASEFIAASIESVLSQTYTNLELLITDDCSTDPKVQEILQHYANIDNRVKLFSNSVNQGAGVSRNNCICHASGRYIAFCDSDDRWLPEKLERQIAFMHDNGYEMTYTAYNVCDEHDNICGIVRGQKRENFGSMLLDDGMGFLTTIYDTARVGKVYMPEMRKRQDWAYKLLLLQQIDTAYGMNDLLAIYRVRHDSVSRNKLSLVKYNINVYRNVLHYSTPKAYFVFAFGFMPKHLLKMARVKFQNL